jgi:hypothetical protein
VYDQFSPPVVYPTELTRLPCNEFKRKLFALAIPLCYGPMAQTYLRRYD